MDVLVECYQRRTGSDTTIASKCTDLPLSIIEGL